RARTPFLQLVAVGLTFTTVLTAFLHMGVVIGLLPTTGLTLPFVSYGRSNLVLTMLFTGILVNIGSTRERVLGTAATYPRAVTASRAWSGLADRHDPNRRRRRRDRRASVPGPGHRAGARGSAAVDRAVLRRRPARNRARRAAGDGVPTRPARPAPALPV